LVKKRVKARNTRDNQSTFRGKHRRLVPTEKNGHFPLRRGRQEPGEGSFMAEKETRGGGWATSYLGSRAGTAGTLTLAEWRSVNKTGIPGPRD